MMNRIGLVVLLIASLLWMPFAFAPKRRRSRRSVAFTGTVTDKTGSVLPDTVVTILSDQTKLTRTQKSNAHGSYDFVNLAHRSTR